MRPRDWPNTTGWAGFFYPAYLGGLGVVAFIAGVRIAGWLFHFDLIFVWR